MIEEDDDGMIEEVVGILVRTQRPLSAPSLWRAQLAQVCSICAAARADKRTGPGSGWEAVADTIFELLEELASDTTSLEPDNEWLMNFSEKPSCEE